MSDLPPPLPPSSPDSTTLHPSPPAPSIAPGPLGAGLVPHRGGTILALGIISLAVNVLALCGGALSSGLGCFGSIIPIALAIPAWVMANTDLRRMNAGLMDPTGRSNTQTGKVCSIISIALSILVIVFAILAVAGLLAVFGIMAASQAGRP